MATLSRVVHTVFSSVSHRGPVVTAKRFLRVDPEEEIERLFLKRSFEQRCQENCRPSPFLKNIERHSDGGVDETQQQQPPRHLASKLIADHEKEIPPLSSLSESRLLSELRPIPIEAIQQDEYIYENESAQAIEILLHYNIFVDLFKANLMFVPDPTINFKVAYNLNDDNGDYVLPVFQGNKVLPTCSSKSPLMSYCGLPNRYYSLLFLNLDGHLLDTCAEYLHWSCGMYIIII